jgi:hypothetical protein
MLALNLCTMGYQKSESVEISAALELLRVSHHSTFAGKGFTLGGKKRRFILAVNRYLVDPLFILRASLHLSVTYLAREKFLTINVPVVYMGGTYGFGWGEIHNDGRLKWWALKVETFLCP